MKIFNKEIDWLKVIEIIVLAFGIVKILELSYKLL